MVPNNSDPRSDNLEGYNLSTEGSNDALLNLGSASKSQNNVPSIMCDQQFDNITSKKIQIKSEPRPEYHPRTLKENEKAAHFIRCEKGEELEYPTTNINLDWKAQSATNYIEVALVDIKHRPHPYSIDNKERSSKDVPKKVVRGEDEAPNVLLFALTDEDFKNGYKSFQIELIKSKQGGKITKELIGERQLEKSKLRFTRVFYDEKDVLHRDDSSTVYSREMTEKYTDITVTDIIPKYGPMSGNQPVIVELAGLKAKNRNKLSVEIVEKSTEWKSTIANLVPVGNSIKISMPRFPNPSNSEILTSIIVYYEGEAIYETPFIYTSKLDTDADSTTSNNNFSSNEDLAGSSQSSSVASKKTSRKNSGKRQHMD